MDKEDVAVVVEIVVAVEVTVETVVEVNAVKVVNAVEVTVEVNVQEAKAVDVAVKAVAAVVPQHNEQIFLTRRFLIPACFDDQSFFRCSKSEPPLAFILKA